jgi:hypothetical protein
MTRSKHFIAAWMSLVVAAACEPTALAPNDDTNARALCVPPPPSSETDRIFQGLRPVCEGCHSTGNRAYFQSLESFQSLVVADPRMVVPGNPDGSELIRLLEGTGQGAFTQMPPGDITYDGMLAAGVGTLPISDVRAWIQGLTATARDPRPNIALPRVRRMEANQLVMAMQRVLGLGYADFYTDGDPAANFGGPAAIARNEDEYPVRGSDESPATWYDPKTRERFQALGGGAINTQTPPDNSVGPTFLLTMTQVSQAWCRKALLKPNNTVLLPEGLPAIDDAAAMQTLVRHWVHEFHARTATDDEVDTIVTNVVTPLSSEGAVVALTGVCSSLLRQPEFLFY